MNVKSPIESFGSLFRRIMSDVIEAPVKSRQPVSPSDVAEYLAKVDAHDRRMARRALPAVENAATRARRKYEASAKGRATRARYTNSAARLESKARYRNTSWGMHARYMWQLRNRIAGRGVEVAS